MSGQIKTDPFAHDTALYKNFLESYYRCIKNKPKTKKSNFHLYHESNILKLAKSVHNKSYKPSKSSVFVVVTPKPREVIAAHLRDRIVHHYLYEYLNSYWNPCFVKNSYACRKGAGPLQAVRDLEVFLKRHKRASSKPLYYLKLDVQSFFASSTIKAYLIAQIT